MCVTRRSCRRRLEEPAQRGPLGLVAAQREGTLDLGPSLRGAVQAQEQLAADRRQPTCVAFDFYDSADGSGTSGGSVQVLPPLDATGSIKAAGGIAGCKGALNSGSYGALSGCTVKVKPTTHDGQLQHLQVPIPSDYSCADTVLTGCWFRVQVTFAPGVDVSDITTWDANINGDPVRLIE